MIAVHVAISSETTTTSLLNVESYSRIEKLLRVTAWIFRFIKRCRQTNAAHTGFLVAEEIHEAENYWIRHVQQQAFREEMTSISKASKTSTRFWMPTTSFGLADACYTLKHLRR